MPRPQAGLPADVNECETRRCSQECTNTYGSYQCYCRQGYQLAEDGHTCTGTPPLPGGALTHWHAFPCGPPEAPCRAGTRGTYTGFSVTSELDSEPCHLLGCVTWGRSSPALTSGFSAVKWRRRSWLSETEAALTDLVQACAS